MGLEKKTEHERRHFERALRRVFVHNKSDSLIVNGRTLKNEYVRKGIKSWLEEGLLYEGKNVNRGNVQSFSREKYSKHTYRLSDKGRVYLGIK